MSPRFTLLFDQEFQYRSIPGLDPGLLFPALPVGLIGPSSADDLLAIVDTGGYSLFDGRRAKSIGLDLMAGKSLHLTALSGTLPARLHAVTLEILGSRFECEVAFSESEIRRELLGRHDLFSRARFGFREGMSLGYFHPQP